MTQVTSNQFPGLTSGNIHIKTPRMPVSPYDKSTIVSIYPKLIDEKKHTIYPGRFVIEPGTEKDPSLLVVGPSSWWKEMEEGQPYLEIPHSSMQIAQSVIMDYCNGIFGCDMGAKMPGLFWVPGKFTKQTITTYVDPETNVNYAQLLEKAKAKQRNFFQEIVKLADIMWARSQGNPLTISDDARIGAVALGMDNKPWLQDFKTVTLSPCRSCGELINTAYPVCKHCKAIINEEQAKAMNLQFAK
ncbi:MAG TPA: hypothetical protein VNX68_17910 [Nitrosopumilaceae archaeon]|jgi:hypothetical protein|nr:hypothetical protein [Nitrosopumilaceae archaeon]